MTVPSILEEISLLPNQKGIRALLPLEFVAFGGGPLKPVVGELLAEAGVKLLNHYGATEVGPLAPIFVPPPQYNWRYFRLRKDMDLEVIPVLSEDGGQKSFRLVTRPFGWTTTFEIHDQLIADPNNPGIDFTSAGRMDNLIVLATGEKVIPNILETMLSESRLVKAAVAFGENQFELGIIVEPVLNLATEDYQDFKTILWPIIVSAGDQMDGHARISSPEAIIIAPPEKIIPRSDKGSVMRREVYRIFEAEIAKVYKDLEKLVTDDSITPLRMDHIKQDLKDLIKNNLNWNVPNKDWTFDDDLFELGMDSLQALRLRRLLLSALSKTNKASWTEIISRDFIYQYPSINEMAGALTNFEAPNGYTNSHIDGHVNGDRRYGEDQIETLQELYSIPTPDRDQHSGKGWVVLLTGSTGSLGTHLLAHLVTVPSIVRVICLNRPHFQAGVAQNPYTRQMEACQAKGVTISTESWSRVEVIQAQSAEPLLGLEEVVYARIRGDVTHILHTAWPVDFKRRLPSFKSQFKTLQNLLNLAREAHATRPMMRPRFVFASSIAVVGQYPSIHGRRIVPETPIDNSACTNPFGYGQAKLVCERIVESAANSFRSEIEAACVRIGQMAGSRGSGFWNTGEHVPVLIRSSQRIGALPRIKGVRRKLFSPGIRAFPTFEIVIKLIVMQTLSWLPVDCAAEVLSELLLTTQPYRPVYHLENPMRQSWHDVLTVLGSRMGLDDKDFLSLDEWLNRALRLEDVSTDGNNPAKQLGDFFREDFAHMAGGGIVLGTEKARIASPMLDHMDVVSDDTIAAYIDNWRRIGFLK
jgi:nucleoside-diphosphate-sugar epimerase